MHLPKNEGGNFEPAPAGTFIARCYRFIDMGSHEQTFQGESTGLKRLVMIGFELPTELMTTGDNAGRPFTVSKRYTWSTHEKSNMRKDLESWRGKKFNDSDFGPGGFDVRNLLGVPATLSITHSEKDGKTYTNITGIGPAMKGVTIPPQVNQSVYLSLEKEFFDGNVFDGLHEKLKDFIRETPEYRRLTEKRQSYGEVSGSSYHAPLDASREIESAGQREFAPIGELEADEIPF